MQARQSRKSAETIMKKSANGAPSVAEFMHAKDAEDRNQLINAPGVVQALSPLQAEFWKEGLAGHPDDAFVQQLFDYMNNGAPIGHQGPREPRESPNWPSAGRFAEATRNNFHVDASKGRMVGPFSEPPLPNFVASPLGAFQKKRSGKIRVIHDLSWPPGKSVNDFIDPEQCRLQYATIDEVVENCRKLGPGPVYMAKLDLKEAFKHIVVRPSDWHLLGSTWDPAQFGLAGSKEYWFSTATI